MAYDHGGRLLSVKKQLNDQGTAKTVLQNEYDELGQLKTKKLGNKPNTSDPLETLAYEYNIRGWLRGINKDYVNNTNSTSFFGQTLSYDVGFTAQQYNGNIAGLQWRSRGDGEQRAYGFDYDAANRLLKADFTQNNGAWNNAAGVDFSVKMGDGADHTTAYDANGNIKAMSQMGLKLGAGGMTSTLVDQLSYHYFDHSNKLKSVLDGVNDITTKLGDFRSSTGYMNALGGTKTAAAIDYGYDVNGNLLTDRNKNMGTAAGLDVSNGGAITYNHLNLPYQIKVKKDDGSDKGTVTYIYDAAGAKLQKITHELASGSTPAKTTTTSYIGGFVYEHAAGGEELQLFPHEEGRVRPLRDASGAITSYAFDYMLKDHLGNVRMVLTEEMKQDVYPAATLEPGKLATEKDYYSISDLQVEEKSNVNGLQDYPNNNVIPNPPVNGTFDNANSTKVYRLNKNSAKMGLGMTLKVMAGDKLNIWGKSYYTDQNTAGNSANEAIPVLDLLNAMLGTPGGSAAASVHGAVTGAQLSGLSSAGINALFSNQTANNNQYATKPKAFINYLFFDEQFKCVGGNFSAVHDNGYTLKDHHGELSDIAVPKNGYVYIYCSNESPVNVFFDNVQVVHTKGAILEETHYYPFGLTMAGISSKAAGGVENKKGYNGNELQNKEFSDGSGLEEYDFNARTYDPQLGRFIQIDPMTDEGGQESWSPYHFGYNNPVRYADPDGEFPIPLLIPFAIKAVEAAIVAYAAYKTSEAVAPHVQKVIENTAEGVRNVQSNGNSFIPLSAQAAKARYEKSLEANNTSAGNQSSASASPSNKGGKDPNDKGKRHEENGGADKGSNKERYRGESGKNRIADKSDEKAITEFKANDNYIQHFSTQIKDGIAHAVKTGREFILKLTRPEAVTKPLKKAAEDGKLKIQ